MPGSRRWQCDRKKMERRKMHQNHSNVNITNFVWEGEECRSGNASHTNCCAVFVFLLPKLPNS